jgi:hypothetical protein
MTVGRSGLATSSLGAVGGARGTAAGGLRILIEFLTKYDASAVKELEADLKSLSSLEQQAANKQISSSRAVETANKRAEALEKQRLKLIATLTAGTKGGSAATNRTLRDIKDQGVLTKAGQAQLKALDLQIGARGKLVKLVTAEAQLQRGLPGLTAKLTKAEQLRLALAEQRLGVERELSFFQNLKGSVLPRLGGLLTGVVGGVFGGALIGVGFAAAQALLDNIEQGLLDVFDPARHAREAIDELGSAINTLAESEKNAGDRQKATIEWLKSIGISADKSTVALLAQAAADKTANDSLEERKKVLEIVAHQEELHTKAVEEYNKQVAKELGLNIALDATRKARGLPTVETQVATEAQLRFNEAVGASASVMAEAAWQASILAANERQLAAAAQLAAFGQQQLAAAIQRGAATQSAPIQSQLESLGNAGPSAKTLALQKQIDKLSGGGGGNKAALANLAQERALILLRMKLRLMGTAINLEKYEGKFLLEAIKAKIDALNKEAAAQDRINRLMDLQYRASQVLRRNEGETISDFLERRAQENRSILQETADIEREAQMESLNELQAVTADKVALAENAEQRRTAAAQAGMNARLKMLQKELAASQKHDAEVTKAKQLALQQQLAAIAENARVAEKYSDKLTTEQIDNAIGAATTITQLQQLSGEITGLTAAKGFLKGLLASGALSASEIKNIEAAIARISSSLSQYNVKLRDIKYGSTVGPWTSGYAKGGLIPLNNASSPFGSNVRFGEEGTEYGLVLQHSIAKTLRGQGRVGQVGPFYMNRTDDWLKDKYAIKNTVVEALGEALR